MSFVLPGNARSLRFTGEAKALAPKSLGKPRVRNPPPPAPTKRPWTPMPHARVISTPSPSGLLSSPFGSRRGGLSTPLPTSGRGGFSPGAIGRPPGPGMSEDDNNPTMAMDRDNADVMPGGRAIRPPSPSPAMGVRAIPHFRAKDRPATGIVPPGARPAPDSARGLPYALWLLASVLVALASYHLTPEILSRLETPAHATER